MAKNPLPGSERMLPPGAVDRGAADPGQQVRVSVILRRQRQDELKRRVEQLHRGERGLQPLDRHDFATQFGADPGDAQAVAAFAGAHGLTVEATDLARRTIMLSGTVAKMEAAFDVSLRRIEHDGVSFRGRIGPLHLPAELIGRVEAVLGLDDRPQAKPHFRRKHTPKASSYTPLQVAKAYGFPDGDGAGQCVALIELGGGFETSDLQTYFTGLGLSAQPNVVAVPVDGASNQPTGQPDGPDGEVMLDIEVVGAIAPAATVAVYFAPNTDAGFIDAVTKAAHDTTNKPSVISISWGGPESSWTAQSIQALDQAFQAAVAMGITVCVASGDNGSSDGAADGKDHVDFPASSPHALACGGTNLQASANAITSETVWNDGGKGGASGGGVSATFALPVWQDGLELTPTGGVAKALSKRGVPDVSGDADPESGYQVRIDGSDTVIGGTSAVAPLWAGLLARINASAGKPAGLINPLLYASPAALNDILNGNNGDFAASKGWDACTGLGSPKGVAVAAALAQPTAN